jgi:predicted O-methyltransferase YrrM
MHRSSTDSKHVDPAGPKQFAEALLDNRASPKRETHLYQELQSIIEQHGGIAEGNTNEIFEETQDMQHLVADPRIKTICETGFNGGHGTLRWLLHSNPHAHVYTFDLGEHEYSKPAAEFLEETFSGRLTAIWGDSTETLPAFHRRHSGIKCNLMFVDGGHDYTVAVGDLKNFMAMADPEYHVILIDDVHCKRNWCKGPQDAWDEMVNSRQITQAMSYTYEHDSRGLAYGTFNITLTGTVS